ncbi:MAG: alpha/beta fold hydrolase [Paracoccaceae bacterium]
MMSRTLRLSDGASIRLIEAGPGEPLLLLHGVGLQAEVWEPQLADLSRDFRVIAADLPGHGDSSVLPGAPDLSDFVAWTAGLVRALDLGAVAVAGHSMGALIAAGLAVDHPALVTRVALLNTVYRRTPDARAAVETRAQAIAAGQADPLAPLDRWFTPAETAHRAQVGAWLQGVSSAGYAAAYRAFAMGDMTYAAGIASLACPVLAMTADGDANSTPAMTQALAAAAPLGRAVVLQGHRHMMPLTAPEAVNAELRRWMAASAPLAQGRIA